MFDKSCTLHNFNMRSNEFITKKIDIHQIIDLKLIRPTIAKSLLFHKPKLNHPLFKNPNSFYAKRTSHSELSIDNEIKHHYYYEYLSITPSNNSPTKLYQ